MMKCYHRNHENDADIFCINENCKEFRIFCFECQKNGMHYGHPESYKKIKEVIQELVSLQNNQREIIDYLQSVKDKINSEFDNLIQGLRSQQLIDWENIKNLNGEEWNKIICNLLKYRNNKEKKLLRNILSNNATYLIEQLNNYHKEIFVEFVPNLENEVDNKNFSYEIMKESSFIDSKCYSFTFNNKQSQMMVGYSNSKIKVFNFENGQTSLFQELHDHENSVFCLEFMRKSNKLVSGSADESICIWEQNNDLRWQLQQQLNGNSQSIICLAINVNENEIICGGYNSQIKRWRQQRSVWQCIQTLKINKGSIKSIAYNNSESHLIFCNNLKQIFVCQQQQDEWEINKEINVDDSGYRLSFIDEKTFAFQRYCQEMLDIYDLDGRQVQLVEVDNGKSRNCNDWFPQRFIREKCILVNKNGSCINFIKVEKDGKLEMKFNIEFQSHDIWGTITYDGEYLITWDGDSKQIQIRKYVIK
ncbi:unnamed protein product [Paramecium sonneborni]|uniref:WD40-repeat-containing domain n=1 Tax=Paramecium sonneborni TaxID=65129 RepID=A0A8S1QX99_9CILI|nr:unnamed protein product [Paramecium sonneborni]